MEIPYVVKARPDTGLYNAKVGIWLFLASEVMLFGALFSSYILLRVGADPGTWPRGLLNIPIGTFNTTVLITSSVTVVLSWASLKMGNFKAYRKYQAVTILCALGFLGIKSFEYRDKWTHYEVWDFRDQAAVRICSRAQHLLRDLLHPDGAAWLARPGWRAGHRVYLGAGGPHVEDGSGALHQPGGSLRPVLALRGPGLDLLVPGALPPVTGHGLNMKL